MIRSPASRFSAIATALAVALGVAACGSDESIRPAPFGDQTTNDTLSSHGFFEEPLADLAPAARVVPYDVGAALWADHAGKARFVALPETGAGSYADDDDWDFPIGTTVIKTFFFPLDLRQPGGPRRIIETRLLSREDSGWIANEYLWNDEQTEAFRAVAGRRVQVSYVDTAGATKEQEYVVPNTNQCQNCHARDDKMHLLGVITPQLNHDVVRDGSSVNQIDWLAGEGLFASAPPSPTGLPKFEDPFGQAPLEGRVRSYLHANCAHCHRPGGAGGSTGLVLLSSETTPEKLGVCKTPIAAGSGTGGHPYDVVPGDPDASILPFRMGATDPEIKMPEIPNRLPDEAGIAIVRDWITGMLPAGCPK